ncbi:MAG: hypothetical protein ACRC7F_06045 [Cetobacterium sp.]|uniref:hypothetical protein n=1 Tax=unclassified Cetobacterium TaxID=2630983 RepID=UPI000646703E|nr:MULTISPECIES: hypothetical protein [unclassified Cetobacterium]
MSFFNFRKIQEIFRNISENIELIFEQRDGRNEICRICGKSVNNNDFSVQFQDESEDKLTSRCLYCNKTFIKAKERISR